MKVERSLQQENKLGSYDISRYYANFQLPVGQMSLNRLAPTLLVLLIPN